MFALQKSKSKAPARQQIAIKGVRDNVLILPGNEYRAILKVSALNFELRSEEEQDAIMDTYESFLNSIGSPLQILIRTREIDMDKYLEDISAARETEPEKIYREQLQYYDEFIRSLITHNKILTRHFYIVVPYKPTGKADFDLIKEQLNLTLDIVSKGMQRIGMHTSELSSLEILDLFYSFYSPSQAKIQPLTEQALKLIHTALIEKGEDNE
ncbi:MAG: TraC family protein [Candidatus Saccharimonadales bacterium]